MSLLTEALRTLEGKENAIGRNAAAVVPQQVRADNADLQARVEENTFVATASFVAIQSECTVVAEPDSSCETGASDSPVIPSPDSVSQLPRVAAPPASDPAPSTGSAERFELFDEGGVSADDLELLDDHAHQADVSVDLSARPNDLEPPKPRLDIAPAYRDARLRILQQFEQDGRNQGQRLVLLLIDVATDGEKSDCGAGVAKAFVEECTGNVALIDAQLPVASPDGNSAKGEHGLTSLVDGTRRLAQIVASTQTPRLQYVGVGLPKGNQQQVDLDSIHRMLSDCRETYDFTIVCGNDCHADHLLPIARGADGVYLVVRQGVTTQADAKEALKYLDHAGIGVRGCLVVA